MQNLNLLDLLHSVIYFDQHLYLPRYFKNFRLLIDLLEILKTIKYLDMNFHQEFDCACFNPMNCLSQIIKMEVFLANLADSKIQ